MRSTKLKDLLYFLTMVLVILFFAPPFVWLLTASITENPTFQVKMGKVTLENYIYVLFKRWDIGISFINSLIISLAHTALVVFVAAPAGYVLSRAKIRFKDELLFLIVLFSTMPLTVIIVPIYSEVLMLNLQDTLLGVTLVITGLGLPFTLVLVKGFVDGILKAYEEAAMVDGASTFQAFLKVIFPLMKVGLLVICVLSFTGAWGNFLIPLVLISSVEKMPASTRLFSLFNERGYVNFGHLAAFSVLYSLPVIILYYFLAKYMGEALVSFTIKG